jgi:hypothetical protein
MNLKVLFIDNTLQVFDETDRKVLDQPYNPYTHLAWSSEEEALSWYSSRDSVYLQPDPQPEEQVNSNIESSTPTE